MTERMKETILSNTLNEITGYQSGLPQMDIGELDPKESALFIIDMVNGFTKEGPMKSERILRSVPEVERTLRLFNSEGFSHVIAFCDSHNKNSPEFLRYPPHCIYGTNESELVDELKAAGGFVVMTKSSTNAALDEEFRTWHWENPQVSNFIVTGCCTDICVMQFALTVKAWLTMNNCICRVIVPVNAVETYDAPGHNALFAAAAALFLMEQAGIELVREIVKK